MPASSRYSPILYQLLALVLLVACLRYFVLVYQGPTGQWGAVIDPSLSSKKGRLSFAAEELALERESLLQHNNDTAASSDHQKTPAEEKTGAAYVTRPFIFGGKRFLDAFVAPSFRLSKSWSSSDKRDDSAVLVLPSFEIRDAPPGICVFRHTRQTSPLFLYRGREAYVCRVPSEELLFAAADQYESGAATTPTTTIRVALHAASGETVIVEASLWPWRQRNVHYAVANTCMVKNFVCRPDHLAEHCFYDWILWHRMQGVQHFFIYDNGSMKNHTWLLAANRLAEQGVVTLIDWPQILGGPARKTQRVQMNHAMFAFSGRVDWLGYFDVDEFLVLSPPDRPLLLPDNQTSELLQKDAASLLSFLRSPETFVSIAVQMRNAQHPDTCLPKSLNTAATTRLASCDLYHNETAGNPKIFVRVGKNGPQPLNSPHIGKIQAKSMHFVHFAKKYGCSNCTTCRTASSCMVYTGLAQWPPVLELEHKLELMDTGNRTVCELTDPPCDGDLE